MDFEEVNIILFFTLNDIYPIATGRAGMLASNNPYVSFPFLRFRFKEKDKNDVIYSKIRDAVKDFKGLLSWEMITFDDVPNYLIVPTYVYSEGRPASGDLNEHLIAKYGENLYRKMIDQAIVDIPNLAKSIRDKFHA
ncbi:hypothetical protein HS960_14055 [Sphingobacterium paramultivorum]|uniref:Uncharacterized protein n=1 Tax=Sphingobacterium paramultivorum TaxID=2886510 RepID=A0A7G5E3X9_9SPHI|nr:hypothetical protein [Sphingobacterium paramultivorum]QMV68704.1 hypothetical protein HS960_14055 [Sphingobacterium paramultivorum]WSO12467.1 hypothetical protein VUL84_14045 [Sphingobacterium paramultivorum]